MELSVCLCIDCVWLEVWIVDYVDICTSAWLPPIFFTRFGLLYINFKFLMWCASTILDLDLSLILDAHLSWLVLCGWFAGICWGYTWFITPIEWRWLTCGTSICDWLTTDDRWDFNASLLLWVIKGDNNGVVGWIIREYLIDCVFGILLCCSGFNRESFIYYDCCDT
jgi:hypothetical protein